MNKPFPIILAILDGFGFSEKAKNNAIYTANTPNWDKLWQACPHTTLSASGLAVGLPRDQMGNSEVGHFTMGAGRPIFQDLTRIEMAIEDGSFYQHETLIQAFEKAKLNQSTVHVLGLLSPGGVHSHQDHLFAMIKLAKEKGISKLIIHAFLDGRDCPPQSALQSIQALENILSSTSLSFRIGSIVGRYYAMDRDKRYDRTQKVYELLTEGIADYHANNAIQGLKMAYERNMTDEFVEPTIIGEKALISDNDLLIFTNFRADRMRQLSYAFLDPKFSGFKRKHIPYLLQCITFTQYDPNLLATVLFPPQKTENLLGEILASHHISQLRLAETEKYAHVTYFFNGGIETPFEGEDRILVPSPLVATYDLCPEMSAVLMTDILIDDLIHERHQVIILNFANADMVGHTGNFQATIKAIEILDDCLGKIVATLESKNGEMIITADHGNAECMFDEHTQQPHTAHTSEKVPFIYVGRNATICKQDGTLADIAPTLLSLIGIPPVKEMTGSSLLNIDNA